MPQSRKETEYAINATTAVLTADCSQSMALIYDRAAGEDRVKPSTGAATDPANFAGYANMGGKAGQSVGLIQIGRAKPLAEVDLLQGDLITPGANGAVKKATDRLSAVGRADSNAMTGGPVTVETSGTY